MKKRTVILVIIALMLVWIGSRFRICTIDSHKTVLFYDPSSVYGSGSARADILKAFDENGKSSELVEEISYIGSNSEGVFYLCKYKEEGNEMEYYAFDDNDLNSTVRAKVFWDSSASD